MTGRMSIWGVGPSISLITLLYSFVVIGASHQWPQWFSLDFVPYSLLVIAACLLLVIAVPVYFFTLRTLAKAYRNHKLATTGMYALCRNPLYAMWIVLILPAIGLLFNSWLVLSIALAMYVATRITIAREEVSLESQFGQEYLDYKRRVHAIIPWWPRR